MTEKRKSRRGGRREKLSVNPDPDTVRRTLTHALKSQNMPKIDLADADQVKDRINWYFQSCLDDGVRPGVEGLCTALHINRLTFQRWANGARRAGLEHQEVAQNARQVLAELMEQYMLEGSINPVAGIFLASNQFDYDRNATVTVQTANALTGGEDPQRLADKYRADVIDVDSRPAPEKLDAPSEE